MLGTGGLARTEQCDNQETDGYNPNYKNRHPVCETAFLPLTVQCGKFVQLRLPDQEMQVNIPGSELLTQVFGYWPAFHDAEVVRIELVRAAPKSDGPDLLADIHAFEITDEVAPSGYLVLRHHVLVSFRFHGIDQVRIEDWNNQNVLHGMRISEIRERQLDVLKYEVCLDSSYGVHAAFLCRSVEIESVRPWEVDDEQISR